MIIQWTLGEFVPALCQSHLIVSIDALCYSFIVHNSTFSCQNNNEEKKKYLLSVSEPSICTNKRDFTRDNGTFYEMFICPQEFQDDDMVDCCGPADRQHCCEPAWGSRRRRGMRCAFPSGISFASLQHERPWLEVNIMDVLFCISVEARYLESCLGC